MPPKTLTEDHIKEAGFPDSCSQRTGIPKTDNLESSAVTTRLDGVNSATQGSTVPRRSCPASSSPQCKSLQAFSSACPGKKAQGKREGKA